mmetsp:Transcript_15614/g.22242  ORF Transcript_15614/g.22242 Transcript_15614/m.22242 type:complete len:336 (-) Transcript_15614:3153-4160(-)
MTEMPLYRKLRMRKYRPMNNWLLRLRNVQCCRKMSLSRSIRMTAALLLLRYLLQKARQILLIQPEDALVYHLRPDQFTRSIATCMQSPTCHIYYFHVPKTGGTSVEYQMFKIFPSTENLMSCCNEGLMNYLIVDNYHNKYCLAKFSSYQLLGNDFQQVVAKCLNTYLPRKKNTPFSFLDSSSPSSHNAIALFSFREPISRMLSQIHQLCNKNIELRDANTTKACFHCNYTQDVAYWDTFVQDQDYLYESLKNVMQMKIPNVQVLAMDAIHITTFFRQLQSVLPVDFQRYFESQDLEHNTESNQNCNFGLVSPMIKSLRKSMDIYRELTLGMTEPE